MSRADGPSRCQAPGTLREVQNENRLDRRNGLCRFGVLHEALNRGHEVTAIARNPEKLKSHANLHPQRGDVYKDDMA
jgi:hypothetical protein